MNKIQLTLVLLLFAFFAHAQRTGTSVLEAEPAVKKLQAPATSLAQAPSTSSSAAQPFFVEDFNAKLQLITDTKVPTTKWKVMPNGVANGGNYWGKRKPIVSKSKGGALVFDVNKFAGNSPASMSESAIIPQAIDCSGKKSVHLKFNQYFRAYNAVCEVLVSNNKGKSWDTFPVNELLNNNIETAKNDYRTVDISESAAGHETVLIGFSLRAENYFWIIDDVELWDVPPFEETFPKELGVALRARNIPYRVDAKGGAYAPNELLIKFFPGSSPAAINQVRTQCNASLLASCRNGELQKWLIGEDIVYGSGEELSTDGGSIDIIEVTKGSKAMPNIEEGSGYNYFVFNDFGLTNPITNVPFSSYPTGGQSTASAKKYTAKIAIIDTGISYGHSGFANRFSSDDTELRDNQDNNSNGYVDDVAGWNFVDDCNNTTDDHSHGTHVSGIVIQHLTNSSASYSILPIKTQDASGLGDIFQSACGAYYAIDSKANIINASWGYYGESSTILSNALMETAKENLLVVAAAGNENVNLDLQQHYPSGLPYDNIISVGAYDSNGLAPYSNYSTTHVDILAPGDVRSFLPSANGVDNYGNKQGTSMSAPAVVAAAAMVYSSGIVDPIAIKKKIMDCASTNQGQIDKVNGGKRINLRAKCLTGEFDTFDDIRVEEKNKVQLEPRN